MTNLEQRHSLLGWWKAQQRMLLLSVELQLLGYRQNLFLNMFFSIPMLRCAYIVYMQ